ncbi:NAD(P)H-binding protein [Microbacterium sp. P02]|uniref:NAD(P)H-binding protein n=1 Tax=unclassified Microbacterium TaxID=2609290 RepID=UPI00366E81B1
MSRIMLVGGHGKVALLLAPLLSARGDQVSAVIRNPDHSEDVLAAGAEPVVADVEKLDVPGLTDLVAGQDAIVWTAGAGGGSAERTWAVDRDAAIRSMDAASAAGVDRYVMVSYFGAGPDHGVPEDDSFFAYAEAKSAADAHLSATDLAWTILQPSALTLDPPTGRIDVEAAESESVGRADVAAVVAAVLVDESTVGRSIRFNSGDVPIVEAVAGA